MAIADLLWACPLCGTAGAVRRVRRGWFGRRRDECSACSAIFRRAAGADISAERDGRSEVRSATEWALAIGPVRVPEPDVDGRILGPDRVLVRSAAGHRPLRYGAELIGWVETYDDAAGGTLTLVNEELVFRPDAGEPVHWPTAGLTGIQPASSALQLAFGRSMVAIRFVDGPLRIWTHALNESVRSHYARSGQDVLEFQPRIRVSAARTPVQP